MRKTLTKRRVQSHGCVGRVCSANRGEHSLASCDASAANHGKRTIPTSGSRRGSSPLLLFEFRPARVERVNGFLRFVQLRARVLETSSIAGDGRIFQRGALGMKRLLGFMDAAFDVCKLAGFGIGKFLFCGGTGGFVGWRTRAPVSVG